MSHSREEIEKIVGDFNKIASRPEPKSAGKNTKMMMGVLAVVTIAILVGVYFYMQKGKKSKAVSASPVASPQSLPQVTISPTNFVV